MLFFWIAYVFPCLLQLLSFGLFHLHHWLFFYLYYTYLQTRKKLQCGRKVCKIWMHKKWRTLTMQAWKTMLKSYLFNIYFLGFWLKIKFNYQMHECMWLLMLIYQSCYHHYDTKATMPNLVLPHIVGLNVRLKVLVLLLIITLICTTRFKHD